MELLLLSNSTLPGKAWLEHALPLIAEQLQGRRSAVFIPFAGVTQTWDDYTAKTAAVLAPLGVSVTGIHSVVDPVAAIENAEIVIVGGGAGGVFLEKAGHNKHGVTHADLRHAVRAAVGAVIVILFVFCHRQLLSLQQFF
mgnify:CR=1 FL=1